MESEEMLEIGNYLLDLASWTLTSKQIARRSCPHRFWFRRSALGTEVLIPNKPPRDSDALVCWLHFEQWGPRLCTSFIPNLGLLRKIYNPPIVGECGLNSLKGNTYFSCKVMWLMGQNFICCSWDVCHIIDLVPPKWIHSTSTPAQWPWDFTCLPHLYSASILLQPFSSMQLSKSKLRCLKKGMLPSYLHQS